MVFGAKLRKEKFPLGEGVVNLNHGSYGLCPSEVQHARVKALEQELAFPDRFYRLDHRDITNQAREIFAKELDAPIESIVCVRNATTGIHTIMQSFTGKYARIEQPTTVVYFSTIYRSCRHMLLSFKQRFGWQLDEIHIPKNVSSPQVIVDLLKTRLKAHVEGTLVLFETVTSMPSIRFPWEEMVSVCRDRAMVSIVDGAHGLGIVPISLSKTRPSFFVTNAHKWYYAPPSVAALYVDPEFVPQVETFPVSWVFYDGEERAKRAMDWTDMFDYVGTADHSATQTIPSLAKFRMEVLGGSKSAMEYQNSLSSMVSAYLCEAWNTTEFAYFGEEYRTALVTLKSPYQPPETAGKQQEFVDFMNECLMRDYQTMVPFLIYEGTVYLRVSCAVYLDLDDFKYGKRVIDEAIHQWKHKHKTSSAL